MIKIAKKEVHGLLREVDEGRFAIPKLQREFVWDGRKAAKLLDSIYNGMPIGVILIWETPKSLRLYLRQKYHVLPPFRDHHSKVWFLIDGQQRVSVLHHIREGSSLMNARGREVDFSRVVFSLRDEDDGQQIRYRRPLPNEYIPLSDILHPQWRHKVGGLPKRVLAKVRECRHRILQYNLFCMFVHMPIAEITECFRRINTQGMKLNTADTIITGAVDLDLRDIVHEVRQHLDGAFKDLPEMPILWAMAAVHGATDARGQTVEQFLRKEEKWAEKNPSLRKSLAGEWSRLGKCFGKAIDYLRDNFKVLNRGFLYSDYMIAMLALFFFRNGRGPSRHQREQIRRWFWATTVGSRYGGRNFLRCVPDDVRFFKRLAGNGRVKFNWSPQADRVDVRKAQYAGHSGIGAAFYSLLLMREPVSVLDQGLNPIPLERFSTPANRKDRHHIFPKAILAGHGVSAQRYNSICNICLLTADENQEVGMRRPHSYLGEVAERSGLFSRKMHRHLIPHADDAGIWDRNVCRGFNRFIKDREDLICRELEREAGMRLFRRDS